MVTVFGLYGRSFTSTSGTAYGSAVRGPYRIAVNLYQPRAEPVEPPSDPWRCLDLAPPAGVLALRRAYRSQMRRYHPDRHPEATQEERERLTRWAVAINAAYAQLGGR